MKTIYLVDGEIVDTRNGFSYRDLWVEIEGVEKTFYESVYGNGDYAFNWSNNDSLITDKDEIKMLEKEFEEEIMNELEYCNKCGEKKEINGVSGYCNDCRPKNR